jgi:hypothetical protein
VTSGVKGTQYYLVSLWRARMPKEVRKDITNEEAAERQIDTAIQEGENHEDERTQPARRSGLA